MTSPSSDKPSPIAFSPLVEKEIIDGVAILTIDNPPVNALSRDLRQALLEHIDAVAEDDTVRATVLVGKHDVFIAGADLKEFGHPLSEPTLLAVIDTIENCPKPVVAAIGGAALGGGYEIALACDARVGTATSSVGLPEGTFGIIPGAGGTVRLPRLTDAVTALQIITSCRQVKAAEAKTLGLLDAIVADLTPDAAAFARSLGNTKNRLRDREPEPYDQNAFDAVGQTALRRSRGRPFVSEQISAIKRATIVPFDDAVADARASFQVLRDSEECTALRHLFFAERQAARIEGAKGVDPLPINSVGIIGAGTMGARIAAAFLSAGYPVTLTDLKPEALATARDRIAEFVKNSPNPAPLSIAVAPEELSDCDLIVEAVFEDMTTKTDLMARIDRFAKQSAILASNTSYLDLDRIAAATHRPASVVGLHFFAPAHVMKLLEIVRGAKTSLPVLQTALSLARSLRKTAVVSRVGDGFIGNRIYNAYRAQCEEMLVDGALPMDIDMAIESFGFAMGPFAASDLSGLDIAWANRKRKQQMSGSKDRDVPVLEWLVSGGRLGRKTEAGWYRYQNGQRVSDPDVSQLIEQARSDRPGDRPRLSQEEIQNRALSAIVNEALLVLEDRIAERASDIDLVLINGYGFPKYVGGPLFWASRQPRKQLEFSLAKVSAGGRLGDLSLLDSAGDV